jgi:hypothetical protein
MWGVDLYSVVLATSNITVMMTSHLPSWVQNQHSLTNFDHRVWPLFLLAYQVCWMWRRVAAEWVFALGGDSHYCDQW